MSGWPLWLLFPTLLVIIGGGGIGGAFLAMTVLELIGQGPDAQRRKREEAERDASYIRNSESLGD